MIVFRETYFKCPRFPCCHTYDMALEILEEAAFAEDRAEILALAAVELMAIDSACEIQRCLVPQRRGARHRLEGRPLLAHDFERPVDFGFADVDRGPRNRRRAQVANRNLGVDLE